MMRAASTRLLVVALASAAALGLLACGFGGDRQSSVSKDDPRCNGAVSSPPTAPAATP